MVGAKVIFATVPSRKAMESVLGYGCHQRLGYGASHESFAVPPSLLLSKLLSIVGWPNGPSIYSQNTLTFSMLYGEVHE